MSVDDRSHSLRNFSIIYEDEQLLAVAKQAGQLVAQDATGDVTLTDLAKDYLQASQSDQDNVYLGVVHRLDRPVSGVLLFTKSREAAAHLSKQFRQGTLQKTYFAWVSGVPEQDTGLLEHWLRRSPSRNRTRVVDETTKDARFCRLTYSVKLQSEGRSLLEITPHTGRHHQIRVQLSSQRWPIVGDVKYGGPKCRNRQALALHARALSFTHPGTNEVTTISAEIPHEWQDAFDFTPGENEGAQFWR